MSRYLVGIDLGTTHSLVAYADTRDPAATVAMFAVDQLVAPGEVAARPQLPSLRYHPAAGELAAADLGLPWAAWDGTAVFGELARELGAKVPGRLVTSAKSWLSHPGVDRTAACLPWGAAAGVAQVSPVDASASYLAYLRAAWNHRFPDAPLEAQEVALTLPASFDEGARLLTVEAARRAGLGGVRLLEEPQAACYDWIARHGEGLGAALADVHLLLVVDVGGGTTDLTLIRVEPGSDAPRLTRIGVGDHLMLGGDNMDLLLAHVAERRLLAEGERLSAARLAALVQQCRRAKERLLAADAPDSVSVTLLGEGGRLIGGARSVGFGREEVRDWLVEGFLPRCGLDERPQGRRAALVEFGLPYAADAAITRHIAAFLARHQAAARTALDLADDVADAVALPDAVLLNGGVFHAAALRERLLAALGDWAGAPPRLLANADPDLAVARGAVAFLRARRGEGVRIGGGSARSYFLLLDGDAGRQGVCVLPRGSEEGQELRLPERVFALRLGEPVHFALVASADETPRKAGELVAVDVENFTALPPVATLLEGRGEARVELAAALSEVGTLALACVAAAPAERRWQLEFALRGEGAEALPAVAVHARFGEAAERILRLYGSRSKDVAAKEVKTLRLDLERLLGPREQWDTALLRELFGVLWEGARRRRRSADHERLWFWLAGYGLRPGFGYPLDDWRIAQVWTLFGQGVQYAGDAQVVSEWWTLWRRVCGGLDAAAQTTLLDAIEAELRAPPGKGAPAALDDRVRLAGSLERVAPARKVALGEALCERLGRKGEPAQIWWALGRLGARVPFHGSAHAVVPAACAAAWCERALAADWKGAPAAPLAAALLARASGDRARDVDPALRARVAERLRAARQPESWVRMVEQVVELDEADRKRVFGEALPPGLRLVA
ncbi:molecular chaperone DnaK (HSP70) [Plasticicumulans lactativorans]|uniref:Molecular chaperone DnaK (HSP70) n=1 Tax=Plasticicumulans lactativorans TaxID=1133106 RepID=A0A4R2LAA1_9GAMM|nr:Hsp70 family protein [Plasticicumulans lactativorans]TCO83129.1 molecular chaperone DnaK (HSP70) [Plasticicumulans lactativorans]